MARQLWHGSVEFEGGWEGFVFAATREEAKRLHEDEAEHLADAETSVSISSEPEDVEAITNRRERVVGLRGPNGEYRATISQAVEVILREGEEEAETERRKGVPGTDEYRAVVESLGQLPLLPPRLAAAPPPDGGEADA